MRQFLKTREEIASWLTEMNIENFDMVKDTKHGFIVNVSHEVNLENKNLSHLPVQFGLVYGAFFCNDNQLTSLAGVPRIVCGNFCGRNNRLNSLVDCPQVVSGYFDCRNNPLLGDAQHIQDFREIFQIHNQQVAIQEERQLLKKSTIAKQTKVLKNYKI